MSNAKVFGIGFHKTGTSSLSLALQILGYVVQGARTDLAHHLFNHNIQPFYDIANKNEAFQDNPWPVLYKEMDKKFPGSKFILTVRDEQKWIKSVINHFGAKHTEMRRYIYGVGHPKGNEEIYIQRYLNHINEVKAHFELRTTDLLVVDWEKGDGWTEICQFLHKPIPNCKFPHVNRGDYYGGKFKRLRKLKRKLRL